VSAYDYIILYSYFTTTDEVGGAEGSDVTHRILMDTVLLILLLYSYF
jgi:hypothetical protein